MRVFSAGELARLRGTQEGAMQDTCVIHAYSSTTDAYGNPTPAYTPGAALACGLEHVRPDEVQGSGEVAVIDAHLRLPLGTGLDTRDRVEITHRYGEALAASQMFEVVGPVKRGPSGLVVELAIV